MSCKYYKFKDGDYHCIKNKKDVDSDWYYKYCRNYDYDDCPIYKEEESSGCFLTSACVLAMGLDDDCYELEVLRRFRDTWLKSSDEGENVIREYYRIAPQIVDAINQSDGRHNIYKNIYEQMVLPCVRLIEARKYREALDLYRNTTLKLKKEYCLV